MQNDAIDTLLDAMPELWKGRRPNGARHTLPSGHTRLDERLPGGGWPIGALTEIITARPGLGELSLLLPALAQLGADGQWVMLVDPPWIPYPPALRARGLAPTRLVYTHGYGVAASPVAQVTRDGLPVRHWVFPGNTVDVTTVKKVKEETSGFFEASLTYNMLDADRAAGPAGADLHGALLARHDPALGHRHRGHRAERHDDHRGPDGDGSARMPETTI